jgi:type I restriction enzyme, R subunit
MDPLDKKKLSERDICSKFITPAIIHAGWNPCPQIREVVNVTDGRVLVNDNSMSRARPTAFFPISRIFPSQSSRRRTIRTALVPGCKQALAYGEMTGQQILGVITGMGDERPYRYSFFVLTTLSSGSFSE